MAEQPTEADVIAYLGLTPGTEDAAQVTEALESALAAQERACTVQPYPATLRRAAIRRTARSLAARSVPLGYISDLGEFGGAATLRRWDAEVEELEGPDRIIPVS